MFPQLQSKYRWLAHKFVEQEFFEDVCTFSVGKDDLRRLIVAKIDIVMRYSYPFSCVHEKLQSFNNDQDPLTCSCVSYGKIAALKQNVKPNISDLNPEDKTLPINNRSGVDVLVKSHGKKKTTLTNSSNRNSVEYKTESKIKRTDKPLYVPPAQRNHAPVSEARAELESMEEKNNKQSKSHLSFRQQKNNVLTRENDHFKNMNADLSNEKECLLDNVVPNPSVSPTQNQLVIDSDKMEESVDSRETAIFKEKADAVGNQEVALLIEFINEKENSFDSITPNPSVGPSQNKLVIDSDKMKESIDSKEPAIFKGKTDTVDNQEIALLIQNCHLGNCNNFLLSESTDAINRFAEGPVSDSELDDVSVTCSENSNHSLLKSDLKVDFNLRTVMNSNNVFEQRANMEIPFTSEHTNSLDTVCSDTIRGLDTDLIKELRAVIGNAEIHSAEHNYSEFKSSNICEEGVIKEEFPDMIEIYGFPVELKTRDLLLVFSNFKSENFTLKWVDDTHAVGIFSSPSLASQALELDHPYVKVRPLAEGLRESKLVAKRHTKNRESPKSRPATSAAIAKRLVTVALGLKVNMPRKEKEKQKIGDATENCETPKSRPATSAASAKRLVTEALGLNVNTPRKGKEKEKQKTKKAKDRKEPAIENDQHT